MSGWSRWSIVCVTAAALVFVAATIRPAIAAPLVDNDTSLPPPTVRHPLALTLGEELGALGVQAAWYWSHSRYWSDGGKDVKTEHFFSNFTSHDDIVFDSDHFNTNGVGHPLAGAVGYQIARGNGMSVRTSFIASFLSAAVWKYFGEWDQRPSLNDLIMTPAAGWVIGEATYRLGRFFAGGKPGVFNCLGTAVLSPFAAVNGASVCGFRQGDRYPSWDLPPTWHRLAAEAGVANEAFGAGETRTESVFGLDGLIRANALYRSPGAGASPAGPGQWSSARARWLVGDGAIRGSTFHADALVIGRYVRRYSERDLPPGEPNGWGTLLGVSSTFDYESRQLPSMFDRTAAAGILGPAFELSVRQDSLSLRLWLGVTYGFAQVTSLAYARVTPTFANVALKRPLQTMGYYYAYGPLSSAALELEDGWFRVALDGRAAAFWSFDHDYDGQYRIKNNFALNDARIFARAIASLQPLGGPIRVAVELDDDLRYSSIPTTFVMLNERRIVMSLAVVSR